MGNQLLKRALPCSSRSVSLMCSSGKLLEIIMIVSRQKGKDDIYWARIRTTFVEESHTLQNYVNSLKEPRIIWIMLVQSYELEFKKR